MGMGLHPSFKGHRVTYKKNGTTVISSLNVQYKNKKFQVTLLFRSLKKKTCILMGKKNFKRNTKGKGFKSA